MTESALPLRSRDYQRVAHPARSLAMPRNARLPAHVGVLMGLAAGGYAVCLAAVTGLQSSTEAQLAADRAPALATIRTVQADHARLERRLESARAAYATAAEAYRANGVGLETMEAKLSELATLMTEINGTASSLPAGVKLPSVRGSVSGGGAPAVHATTAASGG